MSKASELNALMEKKFSEEELDKIEAELNVLMKKAKDNNVADCIDEVLTFSELQEMFDQQHIDLGSLPEKDFDGPSADLGRVFPVSGGLIKCSGCTDDILNSDVLVSEGRERILEVLKKVDAGDIEARFVDLLFCRGCIKGPMMANDESVFVRRDRIVNYIKSQRNSKRQRFGQQQRPIDIGRGSFLVDITRLAGMRIRLG